MIGQASQSPAHLVIASRTPSKIQDCIDVLKADFPDVDYRALQLDLSDRDSVRSAATEVLGWSDVPSIDLVVNSAGISTYIDGQKADSTHVVATWVCVRCYSIRHRSVRPGRRATVDLLPSYLMSKTIADPFAHYF